MTLYFEDNRTVPLRLVLLNLGVTVALGVAGGVLTMIAQRIGPREEPAVDIADSDALTREQAVALVSRMTGQYGNWVQT